jgi:urease accessory protein
MKFGTFYPFVLALLPTPALAHTDVNAAYDLYTGFVHPLLGLDHLAAIMAVGVWAGLIGGRAVWAWPSAFVGVMTLGAMMAVHGASVAGAEISIALSVMLLGLAVALRAPLPITLGALACGLFALFHGHAHGAELPVGAGVGSYIAGFVGATALLHALGVKLGIGLSRLEGPWLPRLIGRAVVLTGLVFLVN